MTITRIKLGAARIADMNLQTQQAAEIARLSAALAETRAQLEEAEKDAARYRWLKECNSGSIGIVAWHRDEEQEMVLVEDMADAAIDAARAAPPLAIIPGDAS